MEIIPEGMEIPAELEFKASGMEADQIGVWSKKAVKKGETYGPFMGVKRKLAEVNDDTYSWEIRGPKGRRIFCIDASDPTQGNWMRYVKSARYYEEQNMIAQQENKNIFYKTLRDIPAGEELLCWYNSGEPPSEEMHQEALLQKAKAKSKNDEETKTKNDNAEEQHQSAEDSKPSKKTEESSSSKTAKAVDKASAKGKPEKTPKQAKQPDSTKTKGTPKKHSTDEESDTKKKSLVKRDLLEDAKTSKRDKSQEKKTKDKRDKSPEKKTKDKRDKSPEKKTKDKRDKSPEKKTKDKRDKSQEKKTKDKRDKSQEKKTKDKRDKSQEKKTKEKRDKSQEKKTTEEKNPQVEEKKTTVKDPQFEEKKTTENKDSQENKTTDMKDSQEKKTTDEKDPQLQEKKSTDKKDKEDKTKHVPAIKVDVDQKEETSPMSDPLVTKLESKVDVKKHLQVEVPDTKLNEKGLLIPHGGLKSPDMPILENMTKDGFLIPSPSKHATTWPAPNNTTTVKDVVVGAAICHEVAPPTISPILPIIKKQQVTPVKVPPKALTDEDDIPLTIVAEAAKAESEPEDKLAIQAPDVSSTEEYSGTEREVHDEGVKESHVTSTRPCTQDSDGDKGMSDSNQKPDVIKETDNKKDAEKHSYAQYDSTSSGDRWEGLIEEFDRGVSKKGKKRKPIYKCHICGASFKKPVYVKVHIAKKHGIQKRKSASKMKVFVPKKREKIRTRSVSTHEKGPDHWPTKRQRKVEHEVNEKIIEKVDSVKKQDTNIVEKTETVEKCPQDIEKEENVMSKVNTLEPMEENLEEPEASDKMLNSSASMIPMMYSSSTYGSQEKKNDGSFQCEFCHRIFRYRIWLQKHLDLKHPGQTPTVTYEDPKPKEKKKPSPVAAVVKQDHVFEDTEELTPEQIEVLRAQGKGTRLKIFPCSVCGRRFSSKTNVRRHKRLIHKILVRPRRTRLPYSEYTVEEEEKPMPANVPERATKVASPRQSPQATAISPRNSPIDTADNGDKVQNTPSPAVGMRKPRKNKSPLKRSRGIHSQEDFADSYLTFPIEQNPNPLSAFMPTKPETPATESSYTNKDLGSTDSNKDSDHGNILARSLGLKKQREDSFQDSLNSAQSKLAQRGSNSVEQNRSPNSYEQNRHPNSFEQSRSPSNFFEQKKHPNSFDQTRSPNSFEQNRSPNSFEQNRHPNSFDQNRHSVSCSPTQRTTAFQGLEQSQIRGPVSKLGKGSNEVAHIPSAHRRKPSKVTHNRGAAAVNNAPKGTGAIQPIYPEVRRPQIGQKAHSRGKSIIKPSDKSLQFENPSVSSPWLYAKKPQPFVPRKPKLEPAGNEARNTSIQMPRQNIPVSQTLFATHQKLETMNVLNLKRKTPTPPPMTEDGVLDLTVRKRPRVSPPPSPPPAPKSIPSAPVDPDMPLDLSSGKGPSRQSHSTASIYQRNPIYATNSMKHHQRPEKPTSFAKVNAQRDRFHHKSSAVYSDHSVLRMQEPKRFQPVLQDRDAFLMKIVDKDSPAHQAGIHQPMLTPMQAQPNRPMLPKANQPSTSFSPVPVISPGKHQISPHAIAAQVVKQAHAQSALRPILPKPHPEAATPMVIGGKVVAYSSPPLRHHKEPSKKHSPTQPLDSKGLQFECNVCSIAFASMKALLKHVAVHSFEWPYKCEFCVRLYQDTDELIRHRTELHHVGKTFSCGICKRDFAYKSNLRKHQTDVHNLTEMDYRELGPKELRSHNFTDPAKYKTGPPEIPTNPKPERPSFLQQEMSKPVKIGKLKLPLKPSTPSPTRSTPSPRKTVPINPQRHHPFAYARQIGYLNMLNDPRNQEVLQTVTTHRCTKCSKEFTETAEFHGHIMECALEGMDKTEPKTKEKEQSVDAEKHTKEVSETEKKMKMKAYAKSRKKAIQLRQGTPGKQKRAKPGLKIYNPKKYTRRRSSASVDDVHACPGCDKKFYFINKLERHMRMCPNRSKFLDKLKGKKSSSESGNDDILKKGHCCPFCTRQFTYLKSLKKHALVCPARNPSEVDPIRLIEENYENARKMATQEEDSSTKTTKGNATEGESPKIAKKRKPALSGDGKKKRRRKKRTDVIPRPKRRRRAADSSDSQSESTMSRNAARGSKSDRVSVKIGQKTPTPKKQETTDSSVKPDSVVKRKLPMDEQTSAAKKSVIDSKKVRLDVKESPIETGKPVVDVIKPSDTVSVNVHKETVTEKTTSETSSSPADDSKNAMENSVAAAVQAALKMANAKAAQITESQKSDNQSSTQGDTAESSRNGFSERTEANKSDTSNATAAVQNYENQMAQEMAEVADKNQNASQLKQNSVSQVNQNSTKTLEPNGNILNGTPGAMSNGRSDVLQDINAHAGDVNTYPVKGRLQSTS